MAKAWNSRRWPRRSSAALRSQAGIGTVAGGIIGTILIRIIDNGLVLSNVDANWFKFAIGFLTIFAVVANAWMRKRAKAIKMEG
ncbi:ribose/xylose/arabinose/galactoside ABC-type transport system permease subunit [Mesorhizobium sp. USDA 4775]